ncbi:LysR family transcriptional regulator [Falsirhodobacter deserti]|uniref:LysR family transcriptional regulator n=1 Tax=Falsirhodobacter deserti TaxID=1365611 RepID=UPI000FE3351B|nr:LysR family transcriptional regulator [Falsirhodobacter deserti]
MRDLNLNAMAQFEAVARLGGVSKAAEELGVSTSAVSQQIRALEQHLGVKLFVREKRGVALTIDGERLYQTANQAFGSLREVRSAIVRQRESFNLTMRVSPSFGERWLSSRIVNFSIQHPEWDIRVDATPNFTEFETEAVDLDLRYGEGAWPGLYAECVQHDLILPMCSPAYRETLRALSADPAEQLRQARLIDSVKAYFRWDYWLARHGISGARQTYPFRVDRSSMAIRMACGNAGVILDSTTLAMDELKSGALVPLTDAFEAIEFPAYWLVCPARHMNRRAVRLFSEWVTEQTKAHTEEARALINSFGLTSRFERKAQFTGDQ